MIVRLFCAACLAAALLPAQPVTLEFEVASIHPAAFPNDAFAAGFGYAVGRNPCATSKLEISGSRVSISKAGICDMIRIAYDVKNYQIVGVPATLGFSGQDKVPGVPMSVGIAEASKQPTYFYDVEARAPGPSVPTNDQVREMLQGLLAARLHLKVHREQRELSYYALVTAANGPKLKPAATDCKRQLDFDVMAACGQTMEELAKQLNATADQVVVDMTGISGKFDYDFPFDRAEGRDFRAFAAAIQSNLKLKLEPRKGPMEVLVVDHVEKPTSN